MRAYTFWTTALILALAGACAHDDKPSTAASAQTKQVAKPAAATSATSATMQGPSTKAGIAVQEAAACRSIQDRAPVDSAEAFPTTVGRVYLYSKVGVDGGGDSSVQHVWYFNGTKLATVTLPVRGASFRTHSSKVIQDSQKGDWRVDIASAQGEVVKSVTFKVE